MDDNKVEVLFGNGAYYEGFVTGVMENEVLKRIKIEGDNELQPTIDRKEGYVLFEIVGTVESIFIAKVLIKHLKDFEKNRKEKQMEMEMQRRYNRNLNADSENTNNGQSSSMRRKSNIYSIHLPQTGTKKRVNEHFLKKN
ncbi:unnamed protein product [Macrosiphum euphorbiae]|uniref:Uncharacterized protein n=1 Tax=Macrosiphum euphorbiae TaxID=13131 RepID=A0AAV0XZY2_9HEMI|nr:unnamed protein product [Macrosiphum euphorbiae]